MPGSRDYNEDAAITLQRDHEYCFVVADGLGGHGKGEVASAIAVETFRQNFETAEIPADSFIPETLLAAQYNIMQEQKVQNATSEMKTTCVVLTISDGIVRIGYIGDTRAYVFQKNKVKYRTLDHSVPQMLVMSGEIREKQIRNHPDRNRLLRVMGIDWNSPQYELIDNIPLADCQAFLLCCDGFWELCDEKKMCAFLKKSTTSEQWLHFMTEEVARNGAGKDMDNYTAIAVIS
jgi:serine/threonine protein phosphatase PrpC